MYILKNKQNGLYLGPSGSWTASQNEAVCFPNALSLVLHIQGRGLGSLENDLEVLPLRTGQG
jgi:hypothetical protein